MLAGPEGGLCHVGMKIGWRADINKIQARISTYFVEVGIAFDIAEIHSGPGRSEVAADTAPIALAFSGVARADGRHPRAPQLGRGQVVDHAHETDADYSDPDH